MRDLLTSRDDIVHIFEAIFVTAILIAIGVMLESIVTPIFVFVAGVILYVSEENIMAVERWTMSDTLTIVAIVMCILAAVFIGIKGLLFKILCFFLLTIYAFLMGVAISEFIDAMDSIVEDIKHYVCKGRS